MSPDLAVRPGADARLMLEGDGPMPGWTAELVIRPRKLLPPVHTTPVKIRPTGIAVELPGAASLQWTFGIGCYEVWLTGPKGQRDLAHAGRVLMNRS